MDNVSEITTIFLLGNIGPTGMLGVWVIWFGVRLHFFGAVGGVLRKLEHHGLGSSLMIT